MLFNSYSFLIFFPVVLCLFFVIPKSFRRFWLLISSYYFYMCWSFQYAFLIAFTTLTTYTCGCIIGFCNKNISYKKWKKLALCTNVAINVLILGFFKYFNFFIENLNAIFKLANLTIINETFNIILPVGISFYTFQALGYSIDVYKGEIKAEKNLLNYALFVSFFPQLVAGPIERSKNLLHQIDKIKEIKVFNYRRICNGFILMLWGFFLKLVLADRIAIIVNNVFDKYYMYSSFELIVAAIGFAFQIYCDFCSYSTIAVGAAQVMGFKLMENFESPYFSRSIREFWRRWHISLSTWFKDYVYIPLGGSRCSYIKKNRNILITFLISGLWHGANWTFIMWGCIHGLYQILGDILAPLKKNIIRKFSIDEQKFSYRLGQNIITFILVDFAWIIFRSNSISDAGKYILRIFSKFNPWALFDGTVYNLGLDRTEFNICAFAILLLFSADFIKYHFKKRIDIFLEEECLWFRWTIIFIILFCVMIWGKYGGTYDAQQFIYFQF